jgi:hypothetical protein
MARSAGHGVAIVAISVLVINAGYGFEGVGKPLGQYEFGSRSLTRPVTGAVQRPHSRNLLYDVLWQFRINRFRGTWLGGWPTPLPEHYVAGFDEQKVETEGIPQRFSKAISEGRVVEERKVPESAADEQSGYPVYLNGELRKTGGWWYYYLLSLVYKIPEGTWVLVMCSVVILLAVRRSRHAWASEIAVGTVPVVILFSMSFLTDINLGLRYVLPMAPYVLVSAGKVVPWASSLRVPLSRVVGVLIAAAAAMTVAASVAIYPHYLAYFNWISGGPDRVPPRLIDSNLDWGQDLVGLKQWYTENIPGQPIGIAYFGQINPSIFALRGEAFRWFLPPAMPGTMRPMDRGVPAESPAGLPELSLTGPADRLTPGYYAISATLVFGLPWRLDDPASPAEDPRVWGPKWNAWDLNAFSYFQRFTPIKKIGHSIYVYKLTEEDVARVRPLLERSVRS